MAVKKQKIDRRTRRTCDRLGMALLELLQDRPIRQITVQQVLDRALVGRSTFYLHFSGKEDLLLSQLEMFLETMSLWLSRTRERSRRVAPVAEMFEHIGSQQKIYRALRDSDKLNAFFDLAQDYFTRGIEQRLRESGRMGKLTRAELRTQATAAAGSLLALLRWWMDRGAKESPKTLDETFHRMIWSGLG
jgi:AcrR family transcriptional regulator